MNSYHIWSIGCQMNMAYADQLEVDLRHLGYQSAAVEEADLIVINTCMVRQSAEDRVLAKLESIEYLKKKSPGIVIALAGCIVTDDTDSLCRNFPHVDLFVKPGESKTIIDIARDNATKSPITELKDPCSPVSFVTIIEGCNNFCSYCIVPYRRGRERSRPVETICAQVQGLVESGVREVTLLGQNVDSYGNDLPGSPDLADLLFELNEIENLSRLRFLTSHPKDMKLKIIEAVASLEKVCEFISLPAQAGDDEILKSMRRGYTSSGYRSLVGTIRDLIPGVGLSTDIIVGFPGETEEQFLKTYDLLSDLRFDTVHVAVYSPREGTVATRNMNDDVPADKKHNRLQRVEDLQRQIAAEINASLIGSVVEILVEGEKKGKWWGRARSNKLVFFQDRDNCLGELVNVKITKAGAWSLQGVRAASPQ